jgi:hypothetical protein
MQVNWLPLEWLRGQQGWHLLNVGVGEPSAERTACRDCDRLIVLRLVSPKQAEIVYDGPGAPVWASAGKMQKNGQRKIALSKLPAT